MCMEIKINNGFDFGRTAGVMKASAIPLWRIICQIVK